MGTHAKDSRSVTTDAARTAVGGLIFCAALYALNLKFPLLDSLTLKQQDLQMIALCVVLFAVFWPLLAKILIAPYLKLIAERERLTTEADSFLQGKESEAQSLTESYETRIADVRADGMKTKLSRIAEAKSQAAKITENAQAEAQALLKDSRAKMREELVQIEAQIDKEADALARSVVERVLDARGSANLRFLLLIVFALAALFVFPGSPLAADEHAVTASNSEVHAVDAHSAGAHGSEHHAGSPWDLKFFFLNFAVYLALVAFLVKKFAPPAWAARRQRIQQAMESSKQKLKMLETRISEARTKLSRVDQDAKSLETVILQETEREIEAIKGAAENAARRILEQAKSTAQVEQKAAAKIAKRRIAERALKAAEEKLAKDMTPEQDRRLREKVHSQVGGLLQ